VWRLTGHRTLKVRATGVEKVLGLAFRGGKLYALEMSTTAGAPTPGTGVIVRVNRHGPPETVVSGLTFPTGMTVGPDGAFYVSNQGSASAPGKARSCASRPDQNERPRASLTGWPGESSAIQASWVPDCQASTPAADESAVRAQ
jgi:hypothetical protein